ncbi:glutaredoxin-related protein 5, mitochondrial-like [Ptychodera flava]|uniref:glutaredoxin-related protein 5, mitochondrial-like n=1 Tax=Ptychodera flava TaxID=63121 RepID=UPI003969C43D
MNVILRLPRSLKSPQVTRILSQSYCAAAQSIKERIDKMVKKDDLVVFMKGVPEQPMCGFSNAVVQILRMHGVDRFASYNVLEDEELRQGIKEYSNWPTIPQLYIKGEFVGGCDIMIQMHQEGELIEELQKIGIKSALLEKAVEEQSEHEKKD